MNSRIYLLLLSLRLLRVSLQKMTDDVKKDLITPIRLLGEGCGYEGCPYVKEGMLNVHIVPHSHGELGHTKTFYQHYTGVDDFYDKSDINWKRILDSTISELWNQEHRKFTLSDMPYLFHWWTHRDDTVHRMVYQLIRQGRLHIVGGAWGMPDEACTSYHALIDLFTFSLRKLNQTFGPCGRPLVAWQADNFGHSKEFTNLVKMLGFDALFINPISYEDELERMNKKELEMVWRGSDDIGRESDIFTHKLFDGYWSPPGFCFGSLCNDPLIVTSDTQFQNFEERVDAFIDSVKNRQGSHYATSHIMVVMGRRTGYYDAPVWFNNIDSLIKKVNEKSYERGDKVNLMYSAPACYLKAVYDSSPALPIKQDDFFPIAFDKMTHLTGLYTSRPTVKYMAREGHVFLQMAKQMHVLARLSPKEIRYYDELNWIVGVFQDHNVITGAMRPHVKDYYTKKMYHAVQRSTLLLKMAFNKLRNSPASTTYYRCSFNVSSCRNTNAKRSFIVIYNPLSWPVTVPVRIPVVRYARHVVYNPKLQTVKAVSMKMSAAVLGLPRRETTADHEIVFMADNLPPMGFRSYYIESVKIAQKKKRRKRSIIKKLRKSKKKKYLSHQTDQLKIDDESMLDTIDDRYEDDINDNPPFPDDADYMKSMPMYNIHVNVDRLSDYETNQIDVDDEEEKKHFGLFGKRKPTTAEDEEITTDRPRPTENDKKYSQSSTLFNEGTVSSEEISRPTKNDDKTTPQDLKTTLYVTQSKPIRNGLWRYSNPTKHVTMKDSKIINKNPYYNKQIKHYRAQDKLASAGHKTNINAIKSIQNNHTRILKSKPEEFHRRNVKHEKHDQIFHSANFNKTIGRIDLASKSKGLKFSQLPNGNTINNTPITISEVYKTNLNQKEVSKLRNMNRLDSKTLKRYTDNFENLAQSAVAEDETNFGPYYNLSSYAGEESVVNTSPVSIDPYGSGDESDDDTSFFKPAFQRPKPKEEDEEDLRRLYEKPLRRMYATRTTPKSTVKTTTEYDPLDDPNFDEDKNYFYRVSGDKFIKNKYVKVHLDSTNQVVRVVLSNGVEIALTISLCYYASDDPVKMGRPDDKKPGPYVFKPMDPAPVFIKDFIRTVVHKSYLVEEVQYSLASWAGFVLRLYVERPVIELDWVVGPIPTSDDIGKDVFIRYSTNLTNEDVFYTDSNGRQTVKRVRNSRPTYQPLLANIPSNFYPVTSKIYIEDVRKNIRFAVLNDRAQGGTSLNDGQIDLMLHRRILTDDDGFQSFLNDTEFSQGITVRGKHHIYISKADYKPNKIFEKKLAKELELSPQVFASPYNAYGDNSKAIWYGQNNEFKGVLAKLPVGIHVLSLQEWDGNTLLLRLENYLEKADLGRSGVKAVFIKDLFASINIVGVKETTLGGNIFLEDKLPLYWHTRDKFVKNFNEFYNGNGTPEYYNEDLSDQDKADISKGITLSPQQIRTFIVSFEYKS